MGQGITKLGVKQLEEARIGVEILGKGWPKEKTTNVEIFRGILGGRWLKKTVMRLVVSKEVVRREWLKKATMRIEISKKK